MTNAEGPKTAATKEAHSGKSTPPLTGLRVIDLTSVIFGPMATSMLAELGADVIKVEPPSGDIMRHVEPIRSPGMSAIYMNANRGKRSVVIDLKKPSGREALLRLAETADVFVHSMRNSAATRLGITYDDIRGLNPALIYCFACGFGSTGPYAELPAYDDIIQAACGLASLAGAADGEPRLVRSIMADKTAGLYLSNAIMTALLARHNTGLGQYVEVPMFECLSAFILTEHLAGASFDPVIDGPGYKRVLSMSRRAHPTKDSFIAVLPYTSAHWQRFLKLIGHDDLASAEWVSDVTQRSARFEELYDLIADVTPTRTTDEWIEALRRIDIPAMPVNQLDDLLRDPQLAASGLFETYEHPTEGTLHGVTSPIKFSDMDRVPGFAPALGADTRDVLSEIGYNNEAINVMNRDGSVICMQVDNE
ncbi:MAG: CoA transferase [Rhodospirillaceae bacterium]|nr:CoA transferase [Rhodospirillaceae bacterium]